MSEPRGRDEQFHEIEELLRERRHRATPLELDRVKLQAKRQAARPSAVTRGGVMKPGRRIVTVAVALGLVASGGGAAAAMSGKIHVFTHHKTASAAWFQYKPPCSPGHKGKWVKVSKHARAAWKHDPCKPHCPPMGKDSKAHASGFNKGCPPPKPPPCGKQSRAHAAGFSHGCTPPPNPCGKQSTAHAAGVSHGCQPTPCSASVRGHAAGANPCQTDGNTQTPTQTTDQQLVPPATVAPVIGSGPTTPTHTVKHKKHRAKHKKHKAKHKKHSKKSKKSKQH